MQTRDRLVLPFTLGFAVVGFLALVAIVGMTFWLVARSQIYFEQAIAARDTRAAAVEIRNDVQTAESSQRGFLLTGNEIYLAPYDTSKSQAGRQLDVLKNTLADDPQSSLAANRLGSLTTEKFGEMDQSIALKRDRRDDEAMALLRTNRGKALMDEANVFFTGIIRGADDRLTAGVSEQRANAGWLRTISFIGAIVIVAVVISAGITLLRYTRALQQARDEVGTLNANLEQRVEERTADLAQANDEIQRFAYIVTHDLRAPLVNIMGFTSELEEGVAHIRPLVERAGEPLSVNDPLIADARTAVNEDLPEAIGFIRTSSKRMDGLISAILKLSREGRRILRPERIELGEVVAASVAAVRHQVSEASGEIHVDVKAPPLVNDRLAIEQMLGNLLDNAVKYRAKDRPLRIDVRASALPGDRIGIEVADNGRGIADQDQERVFELFRRAGTQDQPGEGIGLAHVRTLVRNLGGDISMNSALGQGTTFRMVLPRRLRVTEVVS